jgi:hypothetical protein
LFFFCSFCPAPSIDDAVGKKRAGLFERSEFRRAPDEKPNDEASIMRSGKAQREVRRAAIVRL